MVSYSKFVKKNYFTFILIQNPASNVTGLWRFEVLKAVTAFDDCVELV